jgi:hypothetical protein
MFDHSHLDSWKLAKVISLFAVIMIIKPQLLEVSKIKRNNGIFKAYLKKINIAFL